MVRLDPTVEIGLALGLEVRNEAVSIAESQDIL